MADEELADRRAGDAGTPSRNESPYNVRVVRAIFTPLSRLEKWRGETIGAVWQA